MSLIFCEGFEDLDSSMTTDQIRRHLRRRFSRAYFEQGEIVGGRRAGTKALKFGKSGGESSFLMLPNLGLFTIYVAGFALYVPSLPASNEVVFTFKDRLYADAINLQLTSSGQLSVSTGGIGTVITGTSSAVISESTWHYIEVRLNMAISGDFDIHVDESSVLSDTGNCVGTNLAPIAFAEWFAPEPADFDDAWILDDIYTVSGGGSVNNTILGDTRVVRKVPAADGSDSDWVPASGSDHFAMVDGVGFYSDSIYLQASSSADSEMFTLDQTLYTGTINGIILHGGFQQSDPNFQKVKLKVDSNGTPVTSSDFPVSADPQDEFFVSETDPDTASAWDLAGIHAAEFGFEVV